MLSFTLQDLARTQPLRFLSPKFKLLLTGHIEGLRGDSFRTLAFPLDALWFRACHNRLPPMESIIVDPFTADHYTGRRLLDFGNRTCASPFIPQFFGTPGNYSFRMPLLKFAIMFHQFPSIMADGHRNPVTHFTNSVNRWVRHH